MQQANIINMITNKYEPQQKHRLRTVSKDYWLALNRFYGIPTSPSASVMAQNLQLFGLHEGFLTHQWNITGNKYYDETKMRTRQIQRVATDTWRSLGCRTTPLEHWSKRKPTVEPWWAKQQTQKLRPQPTKLNSFISGPSLSLTPHPIQEGSKVINRKH